MARVHGGAVSVGILCAAVSFVLGTANAATLQRESQLRSGQPINVRERGNEKLVRSYFGAVDKRNFEAVSGLLTPDFEFSTPDGLHVRGPADYVAALERIAPILKNSDIKRIFSDGDEACVIYDFVSDTPVGRIPSVEWIKFKDGRIGSIRLIFHSQPWPKVLEELARRSPSSAK